MMLLLVSVQEKVEDRFFFALWRFNRMSEGFEHIVKVAVSVCDARVEWRVTPVTVTTSHRQVVFVADAVGMVCGSTPGAHENAAGKWR